jgi:hypothetical protein
MGQASPRWWPGGWPWERWQRHRALERRRRAWTGRFLAGDVAVMPDALQKCELDDAPVGLQLEPHVSLHADTLRELFGAWLAVKVCARRLPTDPIDAGIDVLDVFEQCGSELRAQADPVRPIAVDRAPDGGPWHWWALEHPECGIDEAQAIARDINSGGKAAYVDTIDEGARNLRRSIRTTKLLVAIVHLLPLAALALVVAATENIFSTDSWWLVLIFAVGIFVIVDRIIITHAIEPMVEGRQRRILDKTADDLADGLGLGALAAALSRES